MVNYKYGLTAFCILFGVFLISGCSSDTPRITDTEGGINENSTTEEINKVIETAVQSGNPDVCSKIPNKMPTCLFTSACFANVAENNRDARICNKIEPCEDATLGDLTEFARDSCKSDVELAKIRDIASPGSYQNCLKLKGTFERYGDKIERKELCLVQVAVNQSNSEICKMISNGELKDTCLTYTTGMNA